MEKANQYILQHPWMPTISVTATLSQAVTQIEQKGPMSEREVAEMVCSTSVLRCNYFNTKYLHIDQSMKSLSSISKAVANGLQFILMPPSRTVPWGCILPKATTKSSGNMNNKSLERAQILCYMRLGQSSLSPYGSFTFSYAASLLT